MSKLFVDEIQPKTTGGIINAKGHVIQVVHTFKNDVFSTTSTVYVDVTGLSATITPTSTSSKILVQLRSSVGHSGNDYCVLTLVRDSTAIGVASGKDHFALMHPNRNATDTNRYIARGATHMDFLDTPSTTSSTTYKLQMKVNNNTGYINRSGDHDTYRGVSSITLMEIGG